MSRYRKISVKMWGDNRFVSLSKPQPCGQWLWVYLLSGPHTTAFPGAFVAGEAALSESLGWSLMAFRKVFVEVLGKGLIKADPKTRIIFIPKAINHNPPESPNVVKAWRSAFDELPDCPLKEEIFRSTLASLIALGFSEAYQKAFGEAFTLDLPESDSDTEQIQRGSAAEPLPSLYLTFGEFQRVRLLPGEHEKLLAHLNGNLDSYVQRFDRWVHESPEAKQGGVKRKDRNPYLSILNWFDRDSKEGKVKPEPGKQPDKPRPVY